MFVPVGALVYFLSRRLLTVLALGGGFSFAIELYQCLDRQGRVTSTDDVLLNLGGAAIGVLMTLSATRWAAPPDGR
nr:VanZ family protein [Kineosporia mesophila]